MGPRFGGGFSFAEICGMMEERRKIMDKFIEYLLNKGKAETVVATTIFVFFPTYLIVLLYYPEWFKDTDIMKNNSFKYRCISICIYISNDHLFIDEFGIY